MNTIIESDYIIFGTNKIHIIVDNNVNIWFNAKELALSLGYKYPKDVISTLVDKSNKKNYHKLKIFTNIKQNARAIYINESGLYSLLLSSKRPKAKVFKKWVTEQVIPSIREKGYYKLKESHEREISSLMKNIKNARRNLKPEKFPNGGVVYAVDFSENGEEAYKIGKTDDMKKRKALYDTHSYHKRKVPIIEEFSDPAQLENVLREALKKYKYKDKKDVYLCSLKQLEKIFKSSIKFIKKINDDKELQGGGQELYNQVLELKKKIKKLNKQISELKSFTYTSQ